MNAPGDDASEESIHPQPFPMAEANPSADDPATGERERLRAGLLDQLNHLVREVDMLEGVIGRVPEKLLRETPPGEDDARSIKETFALIARLDEAVHVERVRRIQEEETPRLTAAPETDALLSDWNAGPIAEQPVSALFERVRAARRQLIRTFRETAPPGWLRTGVFPATADAGSSDAPHERDLYWMAHALCQRDAARLEGMTRRLYESHLGPAEQQR